MSLLRFIRRERDERKPNPVETLASAAAKPLPVAPRPETMAASATITSPKPPSANPPPLDLNRIRQELEEIARIIGSDDTASGTPLANEVTVDIKLAEIISIAPQAFKDPESLRAASETTLSVPVPRLFEQLTKGKVTTKLSLLVADIPADYLAPYAEENANEMISLPLALVVAAVQPGELRKRTATQGRDLGEANLPNLFTPGSIAAAAAEPEAPAVEPAAAAAPESVSSEPEAIIVPEPQPEPAAPEVAAPLGYTEEKVHEIPAEPEVEEQEIVSAEAIPVESSEPPATPAAQEPAPIVESPAPALEEPALSELPAASVVEEVPAAIVEPEPAPVADVSPEPQLEAAAGLAPAPEAEPASVAGADQGIITGIEEPESYDTSDIGVPEEDDQSGFRVLIGGIDINTATAEDITQRLDGVGIKLARKIVASRLSDGPFSDLYDLARVPGLRAKRFEQVTGLTWDAGQFKYRELIKQIVGISDGKIPDVRQITARFRQVPGFDGCMIIHEDGLVLSASWNHPASDALGAFAPQMFKKINKYVKPLKLGEMTSLCFFVGHQPITVIRSGPVYFAALHKSDSLSKKQVAIAQALAAEIGRRFSSR